MKKKIVAMLFVAMVTPLVLAAVTTTLWATEPVAETLVAAAPAENTQPDGISVVIDGIPVYFPDQGPVVIDGELLVPIYVFEYLGFGVGWDGLLQRAGLNRIPYFFIFTISEPSFFFLRWDGYQLAGWNQFELDVPAQTINGRIVIPLRAPLEKLGYSVDWLAETQTVIIDTSPELNLSEPLPVVRTAPPEAIELFNLVNAERVRLGIPELIWSDTLALAAQIHARDLAINNIWGHIGSDGLYARARVKNLTGGVDVYPGPAGNGARNATPSRAFELLMNSQPHRVALLGTEGFGFETFTHGGVGYYRYGWEIRFYFIISPPPMH